VTNIYTEIAQQQVKKHHTGKKTFFSINECKEEEEEGEKKRIEREQRHTHTYSLTKCVR
jgi:hypothetical protein